MTISDLKAPLESVNATLSVLRGRELLPREEVCIFTLIVKKIKSDVLSSADCLPSQVFGVCWTGDLYSKGTCKPQVGLI